MVVEADDDGGWEAAGRRSRSDWCDDGEACGWWWCGCDEDEGDEATGEELTEPAAPEALDADDMRLALTPQCLDSFM